jgi:multidrug efflux pump subunit AcrA (membrane-fusion protein)
VAEVRPHGSSVKQGDVVLRLEDEKIKDMVRTAEWAARVAERNALDARERYAEYEEDAKRDVARSEKDLALARKSLKGYVEVHRPLEKEEYELSERSQKHSIEDQEDELAQLGKMYKEDELTEQTEEIVLKRARRNLDESKKRLDVLQRQHGFGEEFSEPARRESLENSVKDKVKGLKDLRRARQSGRELGKVDLEKAENEVLQARKRLERLQQDLDRFTFRAPHDGIVIHGGFEEKLAVNPLRKASAVLPNQTLVTVAKAGPLKVRLSVKERDRYRLRAAMNASIVPEALPEVRLAGSLEPISGFPLPDNTWNANVVFGHDDERLTPLLKCKVTVTLADDPDALTLPSSAIFQKGDRAICYLRGTSPFGVVARTVVTGASDGKMVVIREGLSEGDEVLLQAPSP